MAIAQRFITAPFESKTEVDSEFLVVVPALATNSPVFPVVVAGQLPVGLTAATVASVTVNGQTWSQSYSYDVNEGLFRGVAVRTA